MTLYRFSYRRDAFETVYVEAENEDKACEIADQKSEGIDWENAVYDVEYSDHWEADAQEQEEYRKNYVRPQLRGFN